MTVIARNITISHDNMTATFTSNGQAVSDLYLYEQYRLLVAENERLAQMARLPEYRKPQPASENHELTEALRNMRAVARHNFGGK